MPAIWQTATLLVIKRAYAARDEGDVEGLMAAFQPKGLFNLVGDKSVLPQLGCHWQSVPVGSLAHRKL
jgi:hypothetical protein